jgi:hypothetical protein
MPTPLDYPPNTRVKRTFNTDLAPTPKLGIVTAETCGVLNSKLRGCVMVLWDGETKSTMVHPSNLALE